jgi:hypothetical protein
MDVKTAHCVVLRMEPSWSSRIALSASIIRLHGVCPSESSDPSGDGPPC